MNKKLFTSLFVGVMCCTVAYASACKKNDEPKLPEKLQNGYEIVLDEGNSTTVDLSLYISVEETEYTYLVESSVTTVATVSLSENIATVTAVGEGTAKVTASAGEVSVEFPVTVNAKQTVPTVDKTALQAEVDKAVTEQGDYTETSFNIYTVKLEAAKTVLNNKAATQTEIDNALSGLKSAFGSLALRVPAEVDGCAKQFDMLSGTEKQITLSDYVDDSDLSKISYSVISANELIAVGEIDNGAVTLTAATATADTKVEVTIKVLYDGTEKLSVTLEINVIKPADKTALQTAVNGAITSQGDYTQASFEAYTAKLDAAKELLANTAVTQAQIDSALTELQEAAASLVLRVPMEVADAEKTFNILSDAEKEITLSDYIDDSDLSKITYSVTSSDELLTVGAIDDNGKVTLTASTTEEDTEVTVTLKVMYDGVEKLSVVLTVTVLSEPKPVLTNSAVEKNIDIYSLENKREFTLDFTANIENPFNVPLEYSVTLEGEEIELTDENGYAYILENEYSEEAESVVFEVTVNYGNAKSVTYTYTLKICDTTAYRVVNGSFDKDFDGWTMTGDIGEISEYNKYWPDADKDFEGYPMDNVGKYFRGESKEANTGTLASSYFTVGGLKKITFMLGAAGNDNCYVTLENKDGTVLAIWRNTQFRDPDCALKLVPYIADLSAYAGESVRIVLNDNDGGSFKFFTFDELVTYYANEQDLPANAIAVVNELADKSELEAVLENEITEQGDYTAESFEAYRLTVTSAKQMLESISVKQEAIDSAKAAIETAQEALVVRVPFEVENAAKSFKLLSGVDKVLTVADYIDDNNLSSITYKAVSDNDLLTVGEISDGVFTVTAGDASEETVIELTLTAEYKGEKVFEVTITVTVTNEAVPTLKEDAIVIEKDLYTETEKTQLVIDLAGNIENPGDLSLGFTVTRDNEPVELDGAVLTHAYGTLTETVTEVVYNVKVSFTANDEPGELTFTYTLKLKDTSSYRVTNGSFDNEFDGWTITGDIGEISEYDKYWPNADEGFEGYPMDNVGKYFRGESKEVNTGTLASSYFTVGGLNKITFMLGAAGNDNCYVTLEKQDGTVLAIWRNIMFNDPDCALKLVPYIADLSAYAGESVRIVLNDNNGGFGFFTFDELVTYYTNEEDLPANAVAVVNELADKSALETVLEEAITEQGDYTDESYNAYAAKVEAGRVILAYVGATQSAVNSAKSDIESALDALTLRRIEVVQDAETTFTLVSGGVKNIDFASYIDVKNLSSLTYGVTSDNVLVTVEKTEDGKCKLTAATYNEAEPATVTVTLSVQYKNEEAVTVELTITVKSDAVPVLKQESVTNAIDIYALENKQNITLNFAENIDSQGVALTYAVTLNDNEVELEANNCLVFDLTQATYDETETALVYTVTANYGDGENLQYTYTLKIKDTTKYRVVNGGFETGDLTGWTLVDGEIPGRVGSDTKYFDNVEYGKDGTYLFTAICGHPDDTDPTPDGLEGKTGTLRSENFTLKANGWISFKLGGAINELTGIRVVNAQTGEVLAQFRNINNNPKEGVLVQYIYQFTELEENTECYIEIFDNATSGWGLVAVDSIETYYDGTPELVGAIEATNLKQAG